MSVSVKSLGNHKKSNMTVDVVQIQKTEWISFARAIAIISVVLLHISAPILNKYNDINITSWLIGNFYDSMVRFCVPLFFMLSGTLLLNKDYELNLFLKKRFLKIIPPLIFWSLIYMLYDALMNVEVLVKLSWLEIIKEIKNGLFMGSHFHLWFIYTILGLYLFIPIMRKWIKLASKQEIIFFLAIWFVTTLLTMDMFRPFIPKIDLINFSGYIGYFVLGYYLNSIHIKNKVFPFIVYFIGFLVTFLGTTYFTFNDESFNSSFYKYLSPSVLMASIGAFLLVKNLTIKNNKLKKFILEIDRNSFGIYFLHVLVIYGLNFFGLNWSFISPLISIPILTLGVLLISNFIISILKKNRFTKIISG